MSIGQENKAIVGRWFTASGARRAISASSMKSPHPTCFLHYSLHEPRLGREDIKAFMTDFRKAFPDLNFWGVADLIAEGGPTWSDVLASGGTHTAPGSRLPGGRLLRRRVARCTSRERRCCA